MKRLPLFALLCTAALLRAAPEETAEGGRIPHLVKRAGATELVVDGQPLFLRGGELGNSAATNPEYLQPFWAKFAALNLNTIVAPVYWDQIEPQEGKFDYSSLDGLIAQARGQKMHLVLLWFGSWKNSMSCYAPAWIKTDFNRFPRCVDAAGQTQEILSPFSAANRAMDIAAFAHVLRHLREVDGAAHTVVLVQVENEIGMIPDARDHSAEADRRYAAPVPPELLTYLAAHRGGLTAELQDLWSAAGSRSAGSWTEVFGPGAATEELFMAWSFARYTDAVAAAGKAEYPLPMYANASLVRPGYQPGQYVSAGPLPHLRDIWRAAAPALDFIAPDIYFPNFVDWTGRYAADGNPLFIPEALRNEEAGVRALYAFSEHHALGFSPFAIDSIGGSAATALADCYDFIRQIEPLVAGKNPPALMKGLLPASAEQKAQQLRIGAYSLHVTFEHAVPPALADGVIAAVGSGPAGPTNLPAGGLVLALGPDELLVAGTGVTVVFSRTDSSDRVGILSAQEGNWTDGRWKNRRWLSGDETNQGRHLRLEPGRYSMQRIRLYRYPASPRGAAPATEPAEVPAPRADHNSELAHEALVRKAAAGQVDIYFAGDSITRRWDAEEPLYRDLRQNWERNFSGWKVSDFGWGGDKTQNILWRLDHGELDGVTPKVFVLLAGTNNVGEIPTAGSIEQETAGVVTAIQAILGRFQAKAPQATIVLMGIFPRDDQDGFAKMTAINAINARLAKLADGTHIRYLNINDQLTDTSGQLLPGMLNPDRLHPTVKTYQCWADRLKPIFTELVGQPK